MRNEGWGFHNLLPHAGAPSAGSPLVLEAEFFVAKEDPAKLLELPVGDDEMLTAFKANMHSDLQLIVDSKPIHVSKLVMAAKSPKMREMFDSMEDQSQGKIFELKDIQFEIKKINFANLNSNPDQNFE